MRKYAIIVAGGSGTRMGGDMPKQFHSLKGKPMLWWSIKAFHDEDPKTEIIVVLPNDFISFWKNFYETLPTEIRYNHCVASGGATRSDSVQNGLNFVSEIDSLVAIHDGARPVIDRFTIANGWKLAEEKGSAIPFIPLTDSLRKFTEGGSISVDRSVYVAVQTPQVFKTEILKNAYKTCEGRIFTDDASVVESIGYDLSLFEGNLDNIKVTNPRDMEIARLLIDRNV